jgi:hypothetical protein
VIPIDDIIELAVGAAKMVAQLTQAIMASKDLSEDQKRAAIARIRAQHDQDTKDLDALPIHARPTPPFNPSDGHG